MKSRAFGC